MGNEREISGAVAFGLIVFSTAAQAADPAKIARGFADDFAVPRFKAVASAAHAQADAWTKFCAAGPRADTSALKKSFNDLADAWAKVEFVRIGPAAVALRVERFNWWLDRTGATGKALSAMLAAPDALAPDKLASGSVAGQGLPVIERLLYDKDAIDAPRCAVGVAVRAMGRPPSRTPSSPIGRRRTARLRRSPRTRAGTWRSPTARKRQA